MENPWIELVKLYEEDGTCIHPLDKKKIDEINSQLEGKIDEKIQISQRPLPYLGNPYTANVLFLLLNPGYKEGGIGSGEHYELWKKNILHEDMDYPIYELDPEVRKNGSRSHRWFYVRLKQLFGKEDLLKNAEKISKKICFVEYFPYHSKKASSLWKYGGITLPTQEYGFELVRKAVERGAIIVIMKGKKQWLKKICEYKSRIEYYQTTNAQGSSLTKDVVIRGVFPDDYNELREKILGVE
ncbi:MAG: hypothetical protein Q7T16_02310 [Candidatus Burarchaeum sp.]|nr:hypothetical protein [Candidatus Burarchaeum sp.]MDO8339467.1 hypothetical protein [Candidatus Burarchaeum sp.]